MSIYRMIASVFLGMILLGCSRNTIEQIQVNGIDYTSVDLFGARGNGGSDDRLSIQRAFDSGKNIIFKKGTYLLESKTQGSAMLTVKSEKYPSYILFEEGAILKVSSKQPTDYPKPSVIAVIAANSQMIKSITIDGLYVDGNRDNHNLNNTGLLLYERNGAAIKKVILKNASFVNMGGGGVHTQARYNDFTNIYTENCGTHGIGITNTTNKGITNEFYLDGYTSIDDDAYSIDFSGPKDPNNYGYVFPGYGWKGSARNIVSKNSRYGIKTAGYWDLLLENVVIEDSAGNGFFINTDAPGKTLTLKNITIRNAKASGMSLAGETNFIGENILIEGGKVGVQIQRAKVKMNKLIIDAKNESIGCLRMGEYGMELTNFTIKNFGISDKYPVWIAGSEVNLSNGVFENNESSYDIIVNKSADQVSIKNVAFLDTSTKPKGAYIINVQTKGKTIIENCSFAKSSRKMVNDRASRTVMKNNIRRK